MSRGLLITVIFLGAFAFAHAAEPLVTGTEYTKQSWSQETDYARPWHVRVPEDATEKRLPVFIFLHGNGGSGERSLPGFVKRNPTIAARYILIFPDGYGKSWNIVSERSVGDDRGFIEAIIEDVITRPNVMPDKITIMGSSNGAALTNQIAIETELPNIRNYITSVSQLNTYQHDGMNFKAKGDDNNYTEVATPQTGKRILNISGAEDTLVPYAGGPSPRIPAKDATLPFVDAEESIYLWAKHMGYEGEKLTKPTATEGNMEIFSYLDGDVVHFKLTDQGHGATGHIPEKSLLEFLEGE